MYTPTVNVEGLSKEQAARFTGLTLSAIKGFEKKFEAKNGRAPTEDEAKAFCEKTFTKILSSIQNSNTSNSKESRADRLASVKAAADMAGIKFFHRREEEIHETVVAVNEVTRNLFEQISDVAYVPSTLGGETFAFRYDLDEDNNLYMIYATAFCRPDEPFDPLIGMEVAIDKFTAGDTLRVQIQHEKFGQVKLTQLAQVYKKAENEKLELFKATGKVELVGEGTTHAGEGDGGFVESTIG